MLECQEMLSRNIVMFLHSSYVEHVPLYQFLEKYEYILTFPQLPCVECLLSPG